MTVLTSGFFKHQAILNCGNDMPRSVASELRLFTFSKKCSFIQRSFSQSNPANAKRLPSGTPLLYFPLNKPEASGLHIVVPIPSVLNTIRNSFSILFLSNKLYCGCSTEGPTRL